MHRYQAFGLGIHTEIALPEIAVHANVPADLVIRIGRGDASTGTSPEEYRFTADDAHCFWDTVGRFTIRSGREIQVDPLPNVEESVIRLPLLGVCLALALHQRGLLVLHGSAVEHDGHAIVFLGAKGAGKSTMAASLCAEGCGLLSDDIVAIDLDSSASPIVLPGYPTFKLWPDAILSLGGDPEELPRLATGYEKRARYVGDRFVPQALPLESIHILAGGPVARVTPLRRSDALVELVRHSYAARFGNALLQGAAAVEHLAQCVRLTEVVSIDRLERPASLALLQTVAALVIRQSRQAEEASCRVTINARP